MIFTFICILLILLMFTSKYGFIRIGAKSLLIGGAASLVTGFILMSSCESKSLPFSFCGEVAGIINIILSMGLTGLITMAITVYFSLKSGGNK